MNPKRFFVPPFLNFSFFLTIYLVSFSFSSHYYEENILLHLKCSFIWNKIHYHMKSGPNISTLIQLVLLLTCIKNFSPNACFLAFFLSSLYFYNRDQTQDLCFQGRHSAPELKPQPPNASLIFNILFSTTK